MYFQFLESKLFLQHFSEQANNEIIKKCTPFLWYASFKSLKYQFLNGSFIFVHIKDKENSDIWLLLTFPLF